VKLSGYHRPLAAVALATEPPSEILTTTSPSYQQTDSDSLRAALSALVRSWWILLLCGAVAAGATLAYGDRDETASYQASASLSFAQGSYGSVIAGASPNIDPARVVQTAADTLSLPVIGERLVRKLGNRVTAGSTIKPLFSSTKSDVLSIRATSPNPRSAALVANEAAHQYLEYRRLLVRQQLEPVRRILSEQIRSAPSTSFRRSIIAKRNNLEALEAIQDQQAIQVQSATVPVATDGESTKRNVLIALVLGLVVGAAVALLRGPPPKKREDPAPA
jgi:uncharacterized protein involved in exopolysaccharide biosynthesis